MSALIPRRLLLTLTLAAAAMPLSGCPESDTGSGDVPLPPDITFNISSPGKDGNGNWQPVGGKFNVTGKLLTTKNLTQSSLKTVLRDRKSVV